MGSLRRAGVTPSSAASNPCCATCVTRVDCSRPLPCTCRYMWPRVFEVNIIDFFLLETLRVFEPDLHEVLFRERDLVLQERRFERDGRRDEDKAAAERLLEMVSEERRVIVRAALKDLFPPLEWAYGGTNYTEG